MKFTVAICTYNGQDRIPEVLDGLQQQTNPEGIEWEVVVVDNNSSDRTAEVVSQYSKNWRGDSQLRYVFEATQGAGYARQRAIQEAKSDLIGFLDDDNLPKENWLVEAYRFGQEHPQAGVYGGIIHPKLDVPLPPYFNKIKSLLAINNPGSQPFRYQRNDKPRKVPAGAGCVVRQQAWKERVPKQLQLQGRDEKNKKTLLIGNEETEAFFYIQNSDWEIWHNPAMEIWHHLPSKRLEKEYLLKLSRGFGLANHKLRMVRLYPWQRPLMILLTPLYLLSDGYKLASYYLRYRHEFDSDLTKACELQARIGRFMSPFVRA
ncbi:hormogonium polysaccharide biosynthesis glycosyltransferase HpsE [Capilliphycus salinus ALCB114379]|uniref:hormogonium polysaccharide biosynthesis glycosyltransferase HpsE n=1 Tax=Capilliphycus salinus TaxID=2768948 RepID=UPI0039A67C57